VNPATFLCGSGFEMRLVRLLVVLVIVAATAGCAGALVPPLAAGPPPIEAAPPPPADLDNLMYGRRPVLGPPDGAVVVPVTGALPPPPLPAVVLPPPVPAAVLPGPAPGGDLPYTLDSGDKLRVVVFGQEGLTNTYLVDVAGKIAMPLIGA